MLNYTLGSSPPTTDLYTNPLYGTTGTSKYFGTPSYAGIYGTGTTSTAVGDLLAPTSTLTGLLGPASPPRRRYSIGGLPSASMTDYLSLLQQQQNAQNSMNISNLLNETSRSISRSTQLLNQQRTYTNGTTGTVVSSYPNALNTITDKQLANFLNDNILPTTTLPMNYSSQPNISNLCTGYDTVTTTGLYDTVGPSVTATSYLTNPLKPSPSSYYSKPYGSGCSVGGAGGAGYQSYYNMSNYPLNCNRNMSMNSYNNTGIQQQSPYHRPYQYSSNPALSQSNYQLHLANGQPLTGHSGTQLNRDYLNPNNYSMTSGYLNQHFDHHYHLPSSLQTHQTSYNQLPPSLSKLDLDYPKHGETKRQVSFKFDVDTLSIES